VFPAENEEEESREEDAAEDVEDVEQTADFLHLFL